MIVEQHLDENRADAAKNLGTTEKMNDTASGYMDLRKIFALVGALYWLVMTVIIVPIGCVISLYTIIYPLLLIAWIFGLRPEFVVKIEHFICRMVNDHWTSAAQYMGLSVTEYGDDIKNIADRRVLFLCNHLGLVDHFVLMTAFSNKKSLPGRYLWVIFNIWKFTPLGAMWTAHGNFFINGGASRRAEVLEKFSEHIRRIYWKWNFGFIVMYPEGSRLYLIKEAEKRFAEKNELNPFKNCAHPRTGAVHTALTVCGKSLKDETKANAGDYPPLEYVVDCTLGYPKGEVCDLGQAMLGEWPEGNNSSVAVHYKIHKIQPEWQDEKKLKAWLYERYEEKDKLLEDFYTRGAFAGKRRLTSFPISKSLFVEFFWVTIFWFHYNFWARPLALYLFSFVNPF